jgi:hypothetical protein
MITGPVGAGDLKNRSQKSEGQSELNDSTIQRINEPTIRRSQFKLIVRSTWVFQLLTF